MAIDAVFTWVDGDDPEFRQKRMDLAGFTPPEPPRKWRSKSKYTGVSEARENPVVSAAQTEGRFRNMDELRYALRANEVSRQGDVPAGQLWSCAFLGILLRAMHLNGVADRYGRRAAGLVDAVGNDSLSALALHMFGIESFIAARWDLSQDMMNRSARCYATTGEWRLTMDAAAINSLACIARGATDEARELSRRVIEGGRQHGDRITELWGWLEQAEADLREGMAPAPEALSEAGRLSDAGTVHEQLRLLAARAQAAWLARAVWLSRRPGAGCDC